MADAIYTTRQGETVDLACWRHYGRTAEVTEIVMDVNPGLAAKGEFLPIGTAIVMPAITDEQKQPALVQLWD